MGDKQILIVGDYYTSIRQTIEDLKLEGKIVEHKGTYIDSKDIIIIKGVNYIRDESVVWRENSYNMFDIVKYYKEIVDKVCDLPSKQRRTIAYLFNHYYKAM